MSVGPSAFGLEGEPGPGKQEPRSLVRQPDRSNLCGHACVAMVGRLTLEGGVEVVKKTGGPKGLTGARHLRAAVRDLGFEMDEDCTWIPQPSIDDTTGRVNLVGLWICRMRWPRWKKTHWVVVEDGVLLDPGLPLSTLPHDKLVALMVRETKSYLSSGYRIQLPVASRQPSVTSRAGRRDMAPISR